jgi:hypothetical protein
MIEESWTEENKGYLALNFVPFVSISILNKLIGDFLNYRLCTANCFVHFPYCIFYLW